MSKVKKIEPLVRKALEINKSARNDDQMLYIEVIYLINPELLRDFMDTFKNYKKLGLPSFASVERSRRKLQEKHKELRADYETQLARAEKELEYEEYSRT